MSAKYYDRVPREWRQCRRIRRIAAVDNAPPPVALLAHCRSRRGRLLRCRVGRRSFRALTVKGVRDEQPNDRQRQTKKRSANEAPTTICSTENPARQKGWHPTLSRWIGSPPLRGMNLCSSDMQMSPSATNEKSLDADPWIPRGSSA
jgi:hypothetical protein